MWSVLKFIVLGVVLFSTPSAHAQKQDLYEVLGLTKSATAGEIKAAYRKKAMESHPDRFPGDKAKEELFKRAADAFEILNDADLKSNYDRFGTIPSNSGFSDDTKAANGSSDASNSHQEGGTDYSQERARQTYHRASEEIMAHLVRHQSYTTDYLIQEGLNEMNRIFDARLSARTAQDIAGQLADIWTRVGDWKNGDSLKVTEAAMSSSFLWLKKIARVNPEVYNYYFDFGINAMKTSLASISQFPQAGERREAYRRILQLAVDYRRADWYVGAPRGPTPPPPQYRGSSTQTGTYTCDAYLNGQAIKITIEVRFGN